MAAVGKPEEGVAVAVAVAAVDKPEVAAVAAADKSDYLTDVADFEKQ